MKKSDYNDIKKQFLKKEEVKITIPTIKDEMASNFCKHYNDDEDSTPSPGCS